MSTLFESISFPVLIFMFTKGQQRSHILKSSSDYCCCQETLSPFFSDRYCRAEDEEKSNSRVDEIIFSALQLFHHVIVTVNSWVCCVWCQL